MKLHLRGATHDDVDRLADIMCATMPLDPQWFWRFPGQTEYPEDTLRCTRRMLDQFLEDRGEDQYRVKVVTTDIDGTPQPIALAVWQLQYVLAALNSDTNI